MEQFIISTSYLLVFFFSGLGISSNAYSLFTTLNPALQRAALPAPPTALDTLTASIEGERMARMMKISAEKVGRKYEILTKMFIRYFLVCVRLLC